jgi:hypothetical protein
MDDDRGGGRLTGFVQKLFLANREPGKSRCAYSPDPAASSFGSNNCTGADGITVEIACL